MKTKICGECKYYVPYSICPCVGVNNITDCCEKFEPKVITNGDKIRQMSDEELAKEFGYPCPPMLNKHCSGISNEECTECWLKWLKQEAKNE